MNVSVKDLLDAGVHFGHQVRRWNPKSKPFVYDNRHGISIINLEKTYDLLEKAAQAIEEVVASGKQVLLVGTKSKRLNLRELAHPQVCLLREPLDGRNTYQLRDCLCKYCKI